MPPEPPANRDSPNPAPSKPSTTPAPRRRKLRDWLLTLHRCTGFFLVIFVTVAGVTGTVLAFQRELDAALNPQLFQAPEPVPGAAMLDPFAFREQVMAQLPEEKINEVLFNREPGRAVELWLPKSERTAFVDPYTGRILGARKWGEISEGFRLNLIPFIYRMHYSLALGDVGYWLFGVAALLWTIDCFIGAWLTFPPAQKRREGAPGKSWLRRWLPSWLLKTGQLFSTIFTFHRAAGLWLWAMLFVFAWTAVGFNLNPVFKPVMSVFGYHDHPHPPELAQPLEKPALGFQAAHARGRELMQAEANKRGFIIKKEGALGYEAEHGAYSYSVHSSLDLSHRWPGTAIHFDGQTGQLMSFSAPTGERTVNTVTNWLFALHLATVGGLAYRIFVSILGLAIAALAISGIWIWWRKRKGRISAA